MAQKMPVMLDRTKLAEARIFTGISHANPKVNIPPSAVKDFVRGERKVSEILRTVKSDMGPIDKDVSTSVLNNLCNNLLETKIACTNRLYRGIGFDTSRGVIEFLNRGTLKRIDAKNTSLTAREAKARSFIRRYSHGKFGIMMVFDASKIPYVHVTRYMGNIHPEKETGMERFIWVDEEEVRSDKLRKSAIVRFELYKHGKLIFNSRKAPKAEPVLNALKSA